MTPQEEKKLNEDVIKMIASFQVGLELMDEFAHSKLFRRGVKFHAKALMAELEPLLNMVYKSFADSEDEETYLSIERGIREFISKPIEEIFVAGERDKPMSTCANHSRDTDWEENEEEMNKRMDIIGTNGNEGEHYDF